MTSCKVAIVGAGYMAAEHARAFGAVPGVELAGIFSRTTARAQVLAEQYGIGRVCGSIPELYETTGASLVVVTVPELAMRACSVACFEHPWTVLLEKPAGYDLADAKAIAAAAGARQRSVYVALNRRFYSSTRLALEGLGQAKGPRFIRLQDQEDQEQALKAGQPALVVENWMYANSIHVIDYLHAFGRGVVRAVRQVVPWDSCAPGVVIAQVEFESGDLGLYEAVWNRPGPWSVAVSTRDVRYEMRPLEQLTVQMRGERRLQPVELHPWDQSFKPGLRLQAEHAVAAAVGNPSECVPLNDALATMRLVGAIYGLREG